LSSRTQPEERINPVRSVDATPGTAGTVIWVIAVLYTLAGVAIALVLLRQSDGAHPWARLNVYTGGFLLVGGLAGIGQAATFLRSALRSLDTAGEALGLSYDPGILGFAAAVEVGKLAVLLDYARWHLVPALEKPALQALGLAIAAIGSAGLVWTDRWLARHFASAETADALMTRGPYRFVRHPRYVSILLLGLSLPLVFASILGWPVWLVLLVAIRHRIVREESHLRALFGARYEAYCRGTARLVPGIY
jgi:protein-S-isoprenylcysteine O-methyltransferase Ste14